MPRNSRDGSYERYNAVQRISNRYLFNTREQYFLRLCSENKDKENERREFIKVVDQTLESIDYFNREIILKEFFDPDGCKFWWIKIYPRSTYYRFRGEAVKAFLEKFYDKYKESYGFDYYSIVDQPA